MTVKRNNLDYYDAWADAWWSGTDRHLRLLHAIVPARMRWFTPLVGGWTGKDVLEVGCGGGFMTEAVAREGARVIGVDPSDKALEAARRHAAAVGLAIDYRRGVGEALPVGDASLDVVLCVDVLEHLPDVPGALAEIARVLRPGGWFLFDTFDRTWWSWLVAIKVAEDWLGWVPRGTHDWALFIRPDELRRRLRDAGLEPGDIVGLGPVGVRSRLDLVFGRVPTTRVQYMGAARRPTVHLRD